MSKLRTTIEFSNGEKEASLTLVSNMGLSVLEVEWGECDPEIRAKLEEAFEEMEIRNDYEIMSLAVARDNGFKTRISHDGIPPHDGGVRFDE